MKKLFLGTASILLLFGLAIAQEPENQTPQLTVETAVICKDVVNREPVGPGDKFSKDVGKLVCFTKITGASPETEIKHLWYYQDKLLDTISLPVKASTWRTWSRKTIPPEMTGEWKVEIKDANDNLLTTLIFTIEY